ncbi:putative UBP type Zn finger protein [Thermocatellispora tengchongensis]|uniref:Putative UBP type Zn finger protein n=1 Tax=Thermocatellispora tengchongensis TaxID=1073253 RepID=A0A840NY03_9ACTN|nr:hypothetical protein [Thermocatellispora tengchongensis]MBB5130573.1 putative UBP type Zn finger protein [Thermocatellispora tengchongensis]
MRPTHRLEGLRCSDCGTLDALWLDLVRGMVECGECGQRALIHHDAYDQGNEGEDFGEWGAA